MDCTLCDSEGTVLCTMRGMELQKGYSVPNGGVQMRYELLYQPTSVKVHPSELQITTSFHDLNDLHDLNNVLDSLALDFLSGLVNQDLPNTEKVLTNCFESDLI